MKIWGLYREEIVSVDNSALMSIVTKNFCRFKFNKEVELLVDKTLVQRVIDGKSTYLLKWKRLEIISFEFLFIFYPEIPSAQQKVTKVYNTVDKGTTESEKDSQCTTKTCCL